LRRHQRLRRRRFKQQRHRPRISCQQERHRRLQPFRQLAEEVDEAAHLH
jgi:hypothetical protein